MLLYVYRLSPAPTSVQMSCSVSRSDIIVKSWEFRRNHKPPCSVYIRCRGVNGYVLAFTPVSRVRRHIGSFEAAEFTHSQVHRNCYGPRAGLPSFRGRLHSSLRRRGRPQSASNMTTWINSQFPRPDFHRRVQRHYGLQDTGFPLPDFPSRISPPGFPLPEQPLVPEVADAWRELQAEQVEQREDYLGVTRRVRRVFQEWQLRLVVEDLVEDISRVADRGGDDLGAVLRELVCGPGVEGHPLAIAEVARQGRGHPHLAGDGEPLAVGQGQRAAAPGPAQRLVVLEVDQPCRGGLQGLVAEVPVRTPGQLLVGQVGDPRHAGRTEVTGLGEDRRIEVPPKFAAPRFRPPGVLEVVAEVRPAVDLDEQLAQLDERQPFVNESLQFHGALRFLLRLQG